MQSMFCPDKNVIFRRLIFRFLKILKFHMFSHINHCFHDVQHHLIIIIDGLKSQMSNIFAHQIKILIFGFGLRARSQIWSEAESVAVTMWFPCFETLIRWQRRKLKDEAETEVSAERLQIKFSLDRNDFENSSWSFGGCLCGFIRRVLRTPTLTPKRSVRVPQVLGVPLGDFGA